MDAFPQSEHEPARHAADAVKLVPDPHTLITQELAAITRPLQKENIHEPTAMVVDWTEQRDKKGIIGVGENGHNGEGVLKFEKHLIETVNSRFPIQKVFFEEDVKMMPYVRLYYEIGQMPPELKKYLTEQFVREDAAKPHSFKYDVVVACHDAGIPIQFVDSNTHFDRDDYMARKIKEAIGPDLNGLYMFIAGTNHVLHTRLLFRSLAKPTAAYLLEEEYPQSILSICGQTTHALDAPHHYQRYLQRRFQQDLEKLDMKDKPAGIWLKGSPYKGRRESAANDVIISDGFDILATFPGRDLEEEYHDTVSS